MADKKVKTKYTETDLEEFKAVIEAKLEEARYDLELLNNELSHKDDPGTDDTSRSFNVMEDGASTFQKEMNAQRDLQLALSTLKTPAPKHFIAIAEAFLRADSTNLDTALSWLRKGQVQFGFDIVFTIKKR